jgi:hypothetical protein
MRLSVPAVVDPEVRFDVDGGLETVATSTPSSLAVVICVMCGLG